MHLERSQRQLLGNLARMAVSLLALWFLFRQVGGGGVLEALQRADLRLLFLAWCFFLIGVVVRVFRWRALLYGLGLRPPFLRLLRLYLIGGFFNAFLPTGFGGDVVRVLELGRDAEDSSAALGTVLVDRLTGILSLMALGLIVLPFAVGLAPWLRWLFVVVAVGGLVAGGLVLQGNLLRRLAAYLPGKLSLAGQGRLAQIYSAVVGSGSRAIWLALAYSTIFNLLNIGVHWLCARAVGIELAVPFYFVLVPLLSLSLLIPFSVVALASRE